MTIKELKEIMFENYYKWIWFTIENNYHSMKHQKEKYLILHAAKFVKKYLTLVMRENVTDHFWKSKNKKLVIRSEIITQQPNTLENPNFIDIKSITIEHLKTSHKLHKTIRQAKEISRVIEPGKDSTIPLYSEMTKA